MNTYPADHICEAPDCTKLSPTARTCGNACRARKWKIEHRYADHRRGVRNASQRAQTKRQSRYLILRQDGPHLTITGAIVAPSKRVAEKRIGDQPDTCVIAASHLPQIAA